MALSEITKITGAGIATDTNWVGNNANFTGITTAATSFNIGVTTIHSTLIEAHNIKSTGIITATGGSFSGNVTAVDGTFSGNVSIAGTLTYEDVTNIDSVGIITAPALDVDDFLDVGSSIKLGNAGVVTATSFVGALPITGDTNNRVITATGSGGLNGEANLTFSGSVLGLNQSSVDTNYVLDANGGAIFTKTGTFTSNDFNKGHLTVRNTTASQGAFLDLRAASSGGALGVIAKIGAFNTYSGMGYDGALTFSTRQQSTNTMVERVRITHDGRLLVNTSSSRTIANVLSKVQLEGTTADASSISITRNSNNAYPPYLVFGKSRGTSNGGSTIIQDDDNLGVIRFSGADGNDLTNYAAAINANVDGTPGNNVTPGRLIFSTTSSTGSDPTERLRIDSSGRIGIGTATPSKALHVDGTIFASGATTSLDGGLRIQPNNDGTNYGGVIYGGAHNDNNTAIYMRRGADGGSNTIDINSYGMFRVFTGGALASQTERLRITSDGKVGINEQSPQSLLDIHDSASANDTPEIRIESFRPIIRFADRSGSHVDSEICGDDGIKFRISSESDNDTALTERARITSNGILVGKTADAGKGLEIYANNNAALRVQNSHTGQGANDGLLIETSFADALIWNYENSNTRFGTNSIERLRIGNDGTISKYWNSSTVQAAFGGTGQVNGITALPSMAGNPFVVGRDTGTTRSAHFGGHLQFDSGYGIQGTEFSVYGNTSGLYLNSLVSGDNIIFQTHNGSSVGERLRITSDGFVGINESNPRTGLTISKLGDYSTNDGNTYYMPVGKWSSAWNGMNVIQDSTDYWVGFVGGYLKSSSSVNISLAPNRSNTGQQAGMYISGEATGNSSADFTVGKIVGGSATGQGTSGNVRATKSELFRITNSGQLLLGETSAFDSNTAIQFRKDNAGGTSDFVFRNRGNNNNSRVQLKLSTLNRAANGGVFAGIEKYQSGGMSIYNGENSNQYSNINFFTNGWRSLQLRNGNHSGAWCAEIDAYWGTSNGLRMEVGGPQSGTWQAIDFHTSHTGTQRGYIGVTYGGVSYNSSSDYRMKQDVVNLTGAIDRVKSLKPKRFRWKEDLTHTVDGFLAHEAQTVVPESVQGVKDGEQMQVMDNSKLVPVLTAALKEAITEIETLKTKVAALEGS